MPSAMLSGSGSDDHRDQILLVAAVRYEFADLPALPQHHGAVGEFDDVFHVVGDQDHRIAVIAERRDQIEHLPRLSQTQCSRRLIEDDDLAREDGGARNRDRLALAA